MPEFTPRSMRVRAHARKPLTALSPNVAGPTGAQKPPRPKPRIVGAAVPAAQEAPMPVPAPATEEAPAPYVMAPRQFGTRGARKSSSLPPGARRAASLPPDYASEQPSIAGLAGTPIYDELAQQERTRRALSVALYAAQSEGRRLAALARSPRAQKTRPAPGKEVPESPALADLLRVADGWAGSRQSVLAPPTPNRSASVPPTPNNTPAASAPLTPVAELTPIRAAAVATPGTLHRLIARLDEPCPAALARKEAAAALLDAQPMPDPPFAATTQALLVELDATTLSVHDAPFMPVSPLDDAATATLLAELDAATATRRVYASWEDEDKENIDPCAALGSPNSSGTNFPAPKFFESAPAAAAKSWTRAVALPLFVLAAAIGHGAPMLRGPAVVNDSYASEPASEPTPELMALRAFVDATPRRCASTPAAPSCRTDNLPPQH